MNLIFSFFNEKNPVLNLLLLLLSKELRSVIEYDPQHFPGKQIQGIERLISNLLRKERFPI